MVRSKLCGSRCRCVDDEIFPSIIAVSLAMRVLSSIPQASYCVCPSKQKDIYRSLTYDLRFEETNKRYTRSVRQERERCPHLPLAHTTVCKQFVVDSAGDNLGWFRGQVVSTRYDDDDDDDDNNELNNCCTRLSMMTETARK